MARADMESANTVAPHVTNDRQAAGRVIGETQCGEVPVCHDGRSISTQGLGGLVYCIESG